MPIHAHSIYTHLTHSGNQSLHDRLSHSSTYDDNIKVGPRESILTANAIITSKGPVIRRIKAARTRSSAFLSRYAQGDRLVSVAFAW